MRQRAIVTTSLAVILLFVPAHAQDGIQLFEGQDELPSRPVLIDGSDGENSGDERSPTFPTSSFTLRYERHQGAILVEARVHNEDVYFLFDTGASHTTLTSAVARRIGKAPGPDAPRAISQTAGGMVESRFGLIDRLTLGGRMHRGVTFSICDPCGGVYRGKPVAGLLGMNVIGRYLTNFDDASGTIQMRPGRLYAERTRDIKPWVEIDAPRLVRAERDGILLEAGVKNRSPRQIQRLQLAIACANGNKVTSAPVTINRSSTAKVRFPVPAECQPQDIEFLGGTW